MIGGSFKLVIFMIKITIGKYLLTIVMYLSGFVITSLLVGIIFVPERFTLNLLFVILKVLLTIVICSIVIVCGGVAFIFWMGDPLRLSAPKDQTLITIFHEHRKTIEKLRDMVIEDKEKINYINQDRIEGNITESRKKEYRILLSDLYPRGLSYRGLWVFTRDNGVRFVFAQGRILSITAGWQKGIDYEPGVHEKLGIEVPNLDNLGGLSLDIYFREIEPDWYIFYESD